MKVGTIVRTMLLSSIPLLALSLAYSQQEKAGAKYLDPKLPVEERVSDLLSRMTLEEKIA